MAWLYAKNQDDSTQNPNTTRTKAAMMGFSPLNWDVSDPNAPASRTRRRSLKSEGSFRFIHPFVSFHFLSFHFVMFRFALLRFIRPLTHSLTHQFIRQFMRLFILVVVVASSPLSPVTSTTYNQWQTPT